LEVEVVDPHGESQEHDGQEDEAVAGVTHPLPSPLPALHDEHHAHDGSHHQQAKPDPQE